MIGPWDHDFPHNAWHSPRMEWRYEAVRWFDHWLKGIDTGILDEPKFAVYVRDYYPPEPRYRTPFPRALALGGRLADRA